MQNSPGKSNRGKMPLTDCCFLAGVCWEYLSGLSQRVTPPRGQVPNRRLAGAAGQPAAKFALGVSPLGRFKRGKMAKKREPAAASLLESSAGVSPQMPSGSYSTRIGSLRSATKLQRCGLAEGAKYANRLQPGCTELPALGSFSSLFAPGHQGSYLRNGDYWVSCIF